MVRLTGLSAARRAAVARARSEKGVVTHVVATFLGLVEGEADTALVSVDDGEPVEVSVGPGQFVVGSLVSVLVDSLGRPQRVLSSVDDKPVGAEVGAPVETVTALPSLLPSVELSEEERARLDQVAADLAAAQVQWSDYMAAATGQVDALSAMIDAVEEGARTALSDATRALDEELDAVRDRFAYAESAIVNGLGQRNRIVYSEDGPDAQSVPADGGSWNTGDTWNVVIDQNLVSQYRFIGDRWEQAYVRNLAAGSVTALTIGAGAVTAEKLAAGSVTSRTLAVVPEAGQGGLLLDAQGFTIQSADGDRFISLRADTEQTISFVRGDEITFSITPEGELVSKSVAANESFMYQGTELSELLAALPRGVITQTQMRSGPISTGTADARYIHATFTPPTDNRMIRVSTEVNVAGASHAYIQLKQSAGTSVSTRNSTIANAYLDAQTNGAETRFISWVMPSGTEGLNWPTDGTEITMACFIRSLTNTKVVVNGSYGVRLTVEDIGPAVEVETVDPWVPAQSTGDTATGTEAVVSKKTQKRIFTPTWGRSYINTSSVYNWKPDQVFHGGSPAGGALSSLVGFSYSDIVAFCSGAEMVSARVYVKNSHTWSARGATITVGAHGRQSAPASFTGMTTLGSPRFHRGEGRWLGLNNMLAQLKTGAMTGIGFNNGSSSTADYAYFDWRDTRLEITVRK